MKLKSFATLFMALSLSACSGLPEQSLQTHLDKAECCSSLSDLPLTALSVPFHQQVLMDARLPTLDNTALFSADADSSTPLPVMSYQVTSNSPFSMLVRSYIDNNALFAVNVLVYNQEWQLVSNYSAQHFSYHTAGMRGLERVEKMITINPQLNGAKYILISADSALVGTELSRKHPQEIYAQSQHVIGNKQLPLTAQFEPVGVIDVTASAADNNAILTLLSELSPTTQETSVTKPTSSASPEALHTWSLYQSQIDAALTNHDVKQAAAIANEAAEQGFTQAKDYLVQQLAN